MIEKFDVSVIDISSVSLVINKIKLYIENEEKILLNIKNSLSSLSDYYSSDNDKSINNKKNDLYSSLKIMLENKKKYIDYLEFVVNSYIDEDEKVIHNFQIDIN